MSSKDGGGGAAAAAAAAQQALISPSSMGVGGGGGGHGPAAVPGESAANFFPLRSGFAFVQYVLKNFLGVNPMWVVNASLALAALSTFWRWAQNTLYRQARDFVISKVTIESDDALYDIMLRWMADLYLPAQASRAAKVVTVKTTTLEDDEKAMDLLQKNGGGGGGVGGSELINYRAMIGRSPIEFQFEEVSHLFRHKGRFYWFKHERDGTNRRRNNPYEAETTEVCALTLECFGRSAEPIRKLILDAQAHELAKPRSTVRICKAITNPHNFITKPARSIDTVILDQTKKSALLADMNEYLHPRTRRWYSQHGIPYRRGYLFSGAPGTGKSSLTTSLAGLFGLTLHTISLHEAVNDHSLSNFFTNLQSRCIVLLEDIDAAGLKRDDDDDDGNLYMQPPAMPPWPGGMMRPGRRGRVGSVTLSGLLNALDGVASQEGRIVIMTTNYPDKLDEALIRPGRVDMHVRFDLPGKKEMHDLFFSMYKTLTEDSNIAGAKEHERFTADEIDRLADDFSDALPQHTLSLAAIQGYLLQYKHEPRDAVRNAAAWVRAALDERKRAEDKQRSKERAEAKRQALAKAQARVEQAKAEAQAKEELEKLDRESASAEGEEGADASSRLLTPGAAAADWPGLAFSAAKKASSDSAKPHSEVAGQSHGSREATPSPAPISPTSPEKSAVEEKATKTGDGGMKEA